MYLNRNEKCKCSIYRATLDALGGEYEVEVGHGDTRDSYLRDNGVDTYFIVPPAHRRKVIRRVHYFKFDFSFYLFDSH